MWPHQLNVVVDPGQESTCPLQAEVLGLLSPELLSSSTVVVEPSQGSSDPWKS